MTDLPHPTWCHLENCTAGVGGSHKGEFRSVFDDGREVAKLWLQSANGGPVVLVASSPTDPVMLGSEAAQKVASLWAVMAAALIRAVRRGD